MRVRGGVAMTMRTATPRERCLPVRRGGASPAVSTVAVHACRAATPELGYAGDRERTRLVGAWAPGRSPERPTKMKITCSLVH